MYWMNQLSKLVAAAAITFVSLSCSAAAVIGEDITFLDEDGFSFVAYSTRRTSYSQYSRWFKKKPGYELEDYLSKYLYLFPSNYRWDTKSQKGYNLLVVPGGDIASLTKGSFATDQWVTEEDGVFTFRNWDGQTKSSSGHYGVWNTPDNFEKIAYAWVVPSNFEIISYKSNKNGKWQIRGQTISYFGSNQNDLVFTIKYRRRIQGIYTTLKDELSEQSEAQIEQADEGVKVIVGATVLFASGSSKLSADGEKLLNQVAGTLDDLSNERVVVEGHTDNVAIQGELKNVFATNWELSAARALAVLRHLSDAGVDETRLEARALGAQRPRDTNDTEGGRASNRRIELLIAEQ